MKPERSSRGARDRRAGGPGSEQAVRPAPGAVQRHPEHPAWPRCRLVGPNGAGKTTLLQLAVGMMAPTSGTIEVLGGRPAAGPAQLTRVGFVAQDTPTCAGLSIADHLRFGAHLNPHWDQRLATERITNLGLDPAQKAGKLSGGQLDTVAA